MKQTRTRRMEVKQKAENEANTSGAPNKNASSVQSHMAQNSSTKSAAPVFDLGQENRNNNNNTKEQFPEKPRFIQNKWILE